MKILLLIITLFLPRAFILEDTRVHEPKARLVKAMEYHGVKVIHHSEKGWYFTRGGKKCWIKLTK